MNHGKSYIDAEPELVLSDLGIVKGDILTLNYSLAPSESDTSLQVTKDGESLATQDEPGDTGDTCVTNMDVTAHGEDHAGVSYLKSIVVLCVGAHIIIYIRN